MKICRSFTFDAAHYLPGYDGKCGNLHGHRWELLVEVSGDVNSEGFVVDFTVLKRVVEECVISRLDHTCLNCDYLPEIPTCENLILWIRDALDDKSLGAKLTRLRLYESPTSFAELEILDEEK